MSFKAPCGWQWQPRANKLWYFLSRPEFEVSFNRGLQMAIENIVLPIYSR